MKKQQKKLFAFLLSLLLIASCVVGDLGSISMVRAEEALTVSSNEVVVDVSGDEAESIVSGNEADVTVSDNEADVTVSDNEADVAVSGNEAVATVSSNEVEVETVVVVPEALDAAAEQKTASLNLSIAYEAGKRYDLADSSLLADGAEATVAEVAVGATMTVKGATTVNAVYYNDSTKTKEYGSIGYLQCSKNSASAYPFTDNGRCILITPKYDGELVIAAKIGSGKTFKVSTVENATETEYFKWENTTGSNQQTYFEGIELKAGTTYCLFTKGGGTDFYDVTFNYQVEVSDEEEGLPPVELVDGVLAFPTAEGGGRLATGGRGGDVYVVTSLEDYGKGESAIEGTLRYGIDTAPATGRIIVFNVGGTINLQQKLNLKNNITLMGQTAPGEGITIAGYDTGISNLNNLIIRYMHFRVGNDQLLNGGDSFDALWGRDMDTFIIDHCSFGWNTDECLSTYRGQNGTVQWCIISESLTVSGHSKGRHGYGGIFGSDNTVFQYNLIADHTSRNPRMGGGVMGDGNVPATVQVSNNVIYNWGFNNCYGGGNTKTNYINNYHRAGQGTRDNVRDQIHNLGTGVEAEYPGTGFYTSGNVVEGVSNPVINWGGPKDKNEATTAFTSEAFENITLRSAQEAYSLVLNSAGVTYPKRDAIDARVVQSVLDDTGIFVNTEDEVGGYCAPAATRAASYDADLDGIADEWEIANGLDPADNTDSRLLKPGTGYSWVEVFCNEMVMETSKATYVAPNPEASMDMDAVTLVDEGKDVTVTVAATAKNGGSITKVEFYNGEELVGTDFEAPYTHTFSGLADGTYNISARAYDNDRNATQTAPAKLHVNSTAGIGEWTVTDIGTPGHKSTASLIDGVLTVKGSGKIGKSEGSDGAYDKANGTHYADATKDDFAYVYQKVTGDMEIVANLNSYIAADIHSYNGFMFRESLDTDSAAVGLGFGMSKQVENTTIWTAHMVNRATNGGKMSELGGSLDSPSDAAKAGIPFVYNLNFKDGNDFTGMWLKLKREGDVFSGYVSEDGVSWKTVGSLEVDLPETLYLGFAVDANKVANEINNYVTAKFSDIKINTNFATISYDVTDLDFDGVESIAVGEDVAVKLTAGFGYVLPDTIEVTKDGVATDFTYDKATGTILITNASGAYKVTAVGVKRQVVMVDYEEVDACDLLTVTDNGGTITLTQTATSGEIANNPTTDHAVNESYVLFPAVDKYHTMTMKIKVKSVADINGGGKTGVYIGKFIVNDEVNAFSAVAFRGNYSAADGLCGYWTKDATRSGNGNPKCAYELDKEYIVEFVPKSNSHIGRVIDAETGTEIMSKEFKLGESYIKDDMMVQYGIGLIGAVVEISDMKLVDHENNTIFVQESADYTKVYEAVAEAEKIDETLYKNYDETVLAAWNAIVFGLGADKQAEVDAMAEALIAAIDKLEKKDVIVDEASGLPVNVETTPVTEDMSKSDFNVIVPIAVQEQMGVDSPEEFMDLMKTEAANAADFTPTNTVIQSPEMKISLDGGATFVQVNKNNMPATGLTIVLDYPAGTNKSFDFLVGQFITDGWNGQTTGTMEYPEIVKLDNGIQVTVKSASLFAISYVDPNAANDDSDDDNDNSSNVATQAPKTGDNMDVTVIVCGIIIAFAIAAIAMMFYRKRKTCNM